MPKPATHILIAYPSAKTHTLYRAGDGMALATRVELNVIYGRDPNPAKLTSRRFLTEAFALGYLRYIADLDANNLTPDDEMTALAPRETLQFAASFDERDGESRVIKPNSQVISLAN